MMMQGDELKALRTKLGMTQEEFGDAMGMSRKSVNEMETGKAGIGRRTELGARFLEVCGQSNTMFAMALKCRRAAERKVTLDGGDLEQIADWLDTYASLPRDWERGESDAT